MDLLAEDVVVVGLDPARGRIDLGYDAEYLLEAALVVDLVAAGRLAVVGVDAKARVHVVDPTPVEHPVLDQALTWFVTATRPVTDADRAELEEMGRLKRKAALWLAAREQPGVAMKDSLGGFQTWSRTLDHLVARGALEVHDHRSWTGRTSPGHAATPLAQRDQLVGHLHAVLLDGLEPSERARRLLGLLAGTHLLVDAMIGSSHLVTWAPRRRRGEILTRALELRAAEPDDGVRAALEAAGAVADWKIKRASRFE